MEHVSKLADGGRRTKDEGRQTEDGGRKSRSDYKDGLILYVIIRPLSFVLRPLLGALGLDALLFGLRERAVPNNRLTGQDEPHFTFEKDIVGRPA